MLETVLVGVGFGIVIHAAGLTNWGGLPWIDLLGVDLPDMLLLKTAPQALATAIAAALVASARIREETLGRWLAPLTSLAALVLGLVLVTLSQAPDAWRALGPIPSSLLVATLMGLATGCLYAAWAIAALASPGRAGAVAVVSLISNAILTVLAYAMSDELRLLYLAALLAVSVVIFEVVLCLHPSNAAQPDCQPSGKAQAGCATASGMTLRELVAGDSPIRAQAVCMVALIFSFSFVRTTALSEIEDKSALTTLAEVFVVAAALIALAWACLTKAARRSAEKARPHSDQTFPYQAVFPLIATLAILMPVLSGTTLLMAAAALQAAFFGIVAHLPLVAQRSCRAFRDERPATCGATAALLGSAAFFSVSVSTLFSWAIYRNAGVSVTTLLVCALAITYAMLVAYAFLQRDTRFRRHHEALVEEESLAAHSPETAQITATRRRSIEDMAQTYRLTEREADVLLLLARGYSQHGIAARLDVSDNTVRTHLRNLYRKLQIHSRQEAIELVELQRDGTRDGGA